MLLGASPFYRTPDAPIARGLNLTEADYVKARLTALAIETDHFSRDDIYTLFVATRVINFLKGLPIDKSAALDRLFDYPWASQRTGLGMNLLKRLTETGRLSFSTRDGLRENQRFRPELFSRVLAQAGAIGCLNGESIVTGRNANFQDESAARFVPSAAA